MATEPVVTTIIPTYRRPALLRRAILSVLHQTYPHVRICVYDNASGDETEKVVTDITQRDSRVKYHCHSHNIGSYNNFNYGIQRVDSPFFALLSDDDVFVPTFFEKAIEALNRHPGTMFACMSTMATDLDLNVVSAPTAVNAEKVYGSGEGLVAMVNGDAPSIWTGILFRRDVRDGIGLVDVEAGPYADAGYVFHAAARFPFVVTPGIAAVNVVHDNTASSMVKPLNGAWPGWWDRMVSTIVKDTQVSALVRQDIKNIIYPDFRKMAAYQTFRFLGEGRPEAAQQSAIGLRECGHIYVSRLLGFAVWTYNWSRFVRCLLVSVNRRRKAATRRRHSELHVRFGRHVEFIRGLDQSVKSFHA